MFRACLLSVSCAFSITTPAIAQIGGDGSDGDLHPTADVTIDTTGRPDGFDYRSIRIPAGVTVTLVGTNAAMVRVQGDAQIDGTLSADSLPGDPNEPRLGAPGGPGGYFGGDGNVVSAEAGKGPAGGAGGNAFFGHPGWGEPAGHATPGITASQPSTPTYGSARPFDLRGGSGSGGNANPASLGFPGDGGSGGGGTIALLADGRVTVAGTVTARSLGFGSGGSILIRALDGVEIAGEVRADGNSDQLGSFVSGDGFVRLDGWAAAPVITGTVAPNPLALTLPALEELDAPRLGRPWRLQTASLPGDRVGYFFALAPASLPFPFGTLGLDPASLQFLGATTAAAIGVDSEATLTINVPPQQSLAGVPLWVQALSLATPGPGPRLSNTIATTVQS